MLVLSETLAWFVIKPQLYLWLEESVWKQAGLFYSDSNQAECINHRVFYSRFCSCGGHPNPKPMATTFKSTLFKHVSIIFSWVLSQLNLPPATAVLVVISRLSHPEEYSYHPTPLSLHFSYLQFPPFTPPTFTNHFNYHLHLTLVLA